MDGISTNRVSGNNGRRREVSSGWVKISLKQCYPQALSTVYLKVLKETDVSRSL